MRHLSLLALLLAVPAAAGAQLSVQPRRPDRGAVAIDIVVAQPLGAFRDYVKIGGGIDGSLLLNLTPDRAWGLRIDGGFINYGNETKRTRLSNTIGDRIQVDVNTSNNIARFGIGPQLSIPHGRVRPYLHATGGVAYFFTQSSVEGIDDDANDFARTTNFSDWTLNWGAGGGLLIPFTTKNNTVALDLGARYLKNGKTRYLREGSIEDLPDGSIDFSPIESEVELLVYSIGVSIGIR
jgi:hypothetical protein